MSDRETKTKLFRETLENKFDHDRYYIFLRELLGDFQNAAPNRDVDLRENNQLNMFTLAVKSYRFIGNYVDTNKNRIALFSVNLRKDKNIENARSMQRSFVKRLLERNYCAGALVAFHSDDNEEKWRFSLVRLDLEFAQGKLSNKLTPAKRYSYLVGKGEPSHTAEERLFPIFIDDNYQATLDELEEVFSVEAVTKEFFEKYREKYLDIKLYLENNPDFINESESRGFDSEQFAKKLMGQIVFLYFIQKKGWLGVNPFPKELTARDYKNACNKKGQKPKTLVPMVYKPGNAGTYCLDNDALNSLSDEDMEQLADFVEGDPWDTGPRNFMRKIFDECAAQPERNNFFDDYLEPLFYTGLNQNRGLNAYFPPLKCRIPFLNGGLFEEMQGYDWQHNLFSIPNEMFSNRGSKGRDADGVLDVFDRFNFTMAEDEPMEREIAIDPEMLGKVFENLLEVKDRKSKGAFYTPREIVHYMCQESLINYLVGKTGIPDEDIRKFILYGEYFRDSDKQNAQKYLLNIRNRNADDIPLSMEIPETILSYKNNVNRLNEIDELLKNVKIVDPAVGSGAFPLGILNEIVKARETITTYLTIGLHEYDQDMKRIERKTYRMKRDTIKNSIFACDIEPSAVDITRLRLWLSLVIDDQIEGQNREDRDISKRPRELPNLDCNIICGNSLMDEFEGVPLITEHSALNNLSDKQQLSLLYDQKLMMQIARLIDLQSQLYDEKDHNQKESLKTQIQKIYDEIILEQLETNPEAIEKYYQAVQLSSKPFILWQLYFPKVFRDNGGFDIAIGNPPYISAPAQLKDPYLAENRKRIVESKKFKTLNSKWDLYIPFMELGIQLLREGGSFTMIVPYALSHEIYGKKLRQYFMTELDLREVVDLSDTKVFEATVINCIPFAIKKAPENIVSISKLWNSQINKQFELSYSQIIKDPKSFVWVFSVENNQADKTIMKVLGDYCYISKGMVLNADEKKAQGAFKKEDLISQVKDDFHPKIYIEGKDIEKYQINRIRFLEWGTKRSPDELSRPTFEELYIYPKLLCNRIGELKVSIDERGGLFHNDSIFAIVPWWELQDVNNKSISSSIKKFSQYTREKMEVFSKGVSLYYLLAVLNSTRAGKILDEIRSGGYNIYPDHIRNIPIPDASFELQEKIETQVKKLIGMKRSFDNNDDIFELEQVISQEIEELYNRE